MQEERREHARRREEHFAEVSRPTGVT
jgi:hypothetical protein